jgi:hypothetical protein
MLQRLLAGLIPIRARAVELVVVELDGSRHVVHKGTVQHLGITTEPLTIVGVTEHLGYWKDVRRVLFSNARFTVLSRIGRDGLHDSWTPVKLMDLFRDLAPGFAEQLDVASRIAFEGGTTDPGPADQVARAIEALLRYRNALAAHHGLGATNLPQDVSDLAIADLGRQVAARNLSVTAQRDAFAQIRARLADLDGAADLTPERDATAREDARSAAGLPLFPAIEEVASPTPSAVRPRPRNEALLDVEVVAIYW